ncbi:p53 and DNA damage-regulated protein 1 [Holothuria leucospilota]|uniref:P53 and DNA damage-regulated protein 1 n=1 Tax=Holothuria leucospilota TaxID=206669 RepID=A0A9Q1CC47_HOLLE|nr:p53 and DNA damage-regulated protein 1 [Holothuria leucospilota]
MSRGTEFVLRHLGELEELAEEVLTAKQQIVDLDKKRNQNREALRALQNKRKASSKESKEWVCFGNTFLKLPHCKTEEMLKEDQKQLDTEIEKLRDELKPKVKRLRDMEGLPDVKGFDLKSLTKEEALAIHR